MSERTAESIVKLERAMTLLAEAMAIIGEVRRSESEGLECLTNARVSTNRAGEWVSAAIYRMEQRREV